jgi:hypothetical protein
MIVRPQKRHWVGALRALVDAFGELVDALQPSEVSAAPTSPSDALERS